MINRMKNIINELEIDNLMEYTKEMVGVCTCINHWTSVCIYTTQGKDCC